MSNKTGQALVNLALSRVGDDYVFGALVPKDDADWRGPWDCAELCSWAVYQVSKRLYGCSYAGGDPGPGGAGHYRGSAEHLRLPGHGDGDRRHGDGHQHRQRIGGVDGHGIDCGPGSIASGLVHRHHPFQCADLDLGRYPVVASKDVRPIMPRAGRSSMTAETAHQKALERRAIKHGKGQKKRKQKGK